MPSPSWDSLLPTSLGTVAAEASVESFPQQACPSPYTGPAKGVRDLLASGLMYDLGPESPHL